MPLHCGKRHAQRRRIDEKNSNSHRHGHSPEDLVVVAIWRIASTFVRPTKLKIMQNFNKIFPPNSRKRLIQKNVSENTLREDALCVRDPTDRGCIRPTERFCLKTVNVRSEKYLPQDDDHGCYKCGCPDDHSRLPFIFNKQLILK